MKKYIKVIFLYIIYIFWLISFGHAADCISGTWRTCQRTLNMQVRLYNSYSWSVNYYSGNWWQFYSGWIVYISNLQNQVTVSATSSTIYTMSWYISTWSVWWWSGNYTNIQLVNFTSWDWEKFLQANFIKIAEFFDSNVLRFVLDQTSPSQPAILWPGMWSIQTNNINITRTPSIDTWVGISWYYIYFSLNPKWPFTKTRVWNNTWYNIDSDLLPNGTIYRYIQAIDNLWNATDPNYWFFHNKFPTLINGNWYNPSNTNNLNNTNNPANTDIYDTNQEKYHFVADPQQIEQQICNIHGYDDFADCKATLETKYKFKTKIYENYFQTKWLNEESRLLPSALPKSGVDISWDQITVNNEEYRKLLPNSIDNKSMICKNIYTYQTILYRVIIILLCAYIFYNKRNKK